jgi:hypothetical protein
MAKIVLEEQPDFAVLPADSILDLVIEEATVQTVEGRNGPWQKVEVKFKILGIQATGDGSPVENYDSLVTQNIWGSVPFRLTDAAENKLRLWAEAIFQMELGAGFELDTDMFVRRQVRGVTATYDTKSKDPSTGLPFKRHKVDALLPKGGGTGAPTLTAVPAAPVAAPADPWGSAQSEDPPF